MDQVPEEMRPGLTEAARARRTPQNRLQVRAGDQSITVVRAWSSGFAVDAEAKELTRGYVDLYDGVRYLSRCLIVRSSEEEGERVYEFKRSTPALDGPPVDFERGNEDYARPAL